jgi:ubiquinone/menaquinone biosynthesis C-methylase UbiE
MSAKIEEIINELRSFYDFSNKQIISVGAGGGQLVDYAEKARKVIAIDNDLAALKRLEQKLCSKEFMPKFELHNADFYKSEFNADVLVFEFCLHEMPNPEQAIRHALSMTNDIIIIDHYIDSPWAHIVNESEKALISWQAAKGFNIGTQKICVTEQYFANYRDLYEKVKVQGEATISRIEQYKNKTDIIIPMRYYLCKIVGNNDK